jgi:GNAT superfamily N-acetyltransferase
MFSVSPQEQGSGIGKKMLLAAEQYALNEGATSIYMLVISVREELIGWYSATDIKIRERKPFTEDD